MDSIRNLPTTATFGWSCIFFYGIAIVAYLIPVAFTSAELATTFPSDGGVYTWVREAFGRKWGFLAVWCDWSENIVWFPTVLVFLATTVAYVFDPDLADNKAFLVTIMLVIFWGTTAGGLRRRGGVGSADRRARHRRDRRADRHHHRPRRLVGPVRPSVADPLRGRRHHPRVGGPHQPGVRGQHRRGLRRDGDRWLLRRATPASPRRPIPSRSRWPRSWSPRCRSSAAWPSPSWCPRATSA